MSIDGAYNFLQLVFNKKQAGNITVSDFNNLANICQISMLNELLGNEQEYQPGMPLPKTGYSLNQKNREELKALIKRSTALSAPLGLLPYPADYVYYDTLTTVGGILITQAAPDEVAILNQSQIKPPTAQYPRLTEYSDGIRITPATIVSVNMTYVRQPATPLWNYTIVNNEPVYAATGGVIGDGNSVDWELSELVHIRICMKMAAYFGVNLSLADVAAFAMAQETQGQ